MKNFIIHYKKPAITGVIFILLALIWLLPYFLGWEDWYSLSNVLLQVLLTAIIFLVVAFLLYINHLRQSKEDIAMNREQALKREQIAKAADFLKKEAKYFYTTIKSLFKGFGLQKKYFLKQLPWYLVLGYAGSGKSSLLSRANLSFIDAEHAPRKVADDIYPHVWHFAKEGVFLELPLHNPQDEPLADESKPLIDKDRLLEQWGSFLSVLLKFIRRYRGKSRLNGVVVAIDLPDLLFRTDEKNVTQQAGLKSILNRTYRTLKTQAPVYLMLTKCDLIAGFREFFADVSKEDRDQMWGIAFPKAPFADKGQAVAYFKKEFDLLIDKLHARLLQRLEMERHTDHRALISYFPQQIQLCKQTLIDFIVQDESAQLRGIYFSSSLQEGMPADLLMHTLSGKFDLNRKEPFNSLPQKKSYFIRQFFMDIVLPEADLALHSPYWQRRNMLTYRMSWVAAGLFLMLGVVSFSHSYVSNNRNLDKLAEYLPAYQQAANEFLPTDKALVDTFPLLATLKNIQSIFNQTYYWSGWLELYEPFKIRNKINAVWEKTLSLILMPRVALRIEALLQEDKLDAEVLYQALKGYLVFGVNSVVDREWLKPPIAYDLSNTLPDQFDEQAQLNGYLEEALEQPIKAKSLNESVISRARQRLKQIPPVQFAYYEMKQEAERSHNQLSLEEKFGTDFSNVFMYVDTHTTTIPALYTYEGYKNLQGKRSELLIQHTAETYKILGLEPAVDLNALSTQMTPMLWTLYGTDYVQHWQRLLENITVVSFASLPHAIQTIDSLLSPHSPLLKLLHLIKENTSSVRSKYLQVSQQFSAVNNATGVSKSAIQYTRALKTLSALREYLVTLSNSPNVPQAEFQDAVAIMQNKLPNNPIVLLRVQAQQLPAPLGTWLTEVADHSMGLLLQGAHQVANAAWQSNVMPYYQANIKGRFPFATEAGNAVNIPNFGAFFGSSGVFSQFFQTYLAPFIDTAHGGEQYTFGEHSLGLTESTLLQLNRALLIRNMYFQNGDNNPAMQFLIKPRYLDSQASSINVQLANQSINYRHGPQQSISWKWPFMGDAQQVSVSFSDFQGHNYSRSFDGPWAWFELLSMSDLEETDASGRYIWTVNDDQHKASFELSAPSNLPVFDLHLLKEFSLPDTL